MPQIYDRKNNSIINENEPLFIKFLYNSIIGRLFLKVLKQPIFSKIGCLFLRSSFSIFMIKPFVKKYSINTNLYTKSKYNNFNDFFTRQYKRIDISSTDSKDLISICDSKVSCFTINKNLELEIKNSIYRFNDLIQDEKLANEYSNGICLVFRLTPENYHRYIFFDSGKLVSSKFIKGKLHSVKPIALRKYPVFIQNCRNVSVLNTNNFGRVLQIEIGAMLIGKIKNYNKPVFNRFEEKGYFEYGGSTICLVFKENTIKIDRDILENSLNNLETKINIGEIIGRKY